MEKSDKRRRNLSIVAIAAAVVAALISLATFGMSLPDNPSSKITFNGPIVADSNGEITVVVDSESNRALLLNKDYELTGIVNCHTLNSPIDSIINVCVSDTTVYVTGIKYKSDSDIIAQERVVAYSKRGLAEQVVFDFEEKDYTETPTIKAMDNDGDNGAYIVLASEGLLIEGEYGVKVVHVNREGEQGEASTTTYNMAAHDMGYSVASNVLEGLSYRGVVGDTYWNGDNKQESPYSDYAFTSIDIGDNGNYYLYDDKSRAIYCIDDKGIHQLIKGDGYSSLHVNGEVLVACNRESNAVMISDINAKSFMKLQAVAPSKSVAILSGIVLASHIYLALFAMVVVILKARQLVMDGNTESVGPMFASVTVVAVVSMAIAYTTYGTYKAMMETRANEIGAFADYLQRVSHELSKDMEACDNRDRFRKSNEEADKAIESVLRIDEVVGGLASAATDNGVGTYAVVYGKDDKGVFYLYDSSTTHVMGVSTALSSNKEEIEKVFETNTTDAEMRTGRSPRDVTQYRLVSIPASDESGTVGVVEIGSRMRTFESSVAQGQAQRILALLVLVLVVYLTYSEVRACGECFIEYGRLRHHHDSIAILTRPFSFCVTILSSTDAVMTTLIARALLQGTAHESSGFLLALPAVMMGVGLALGQVIYGFLGSRILIHRLMRRGALIMVFAALFTAGAVWSGLFWLYCAAKLIMAIPFGLLYTLSYSLPRRADSDEVRVLAAGGIKRTDTSAAALGTVMGGYVAQSLGNAWVYVLVAVLGVAVFLMAEHVLPRSGHPLEHDNGERLSRRQAVVRLVTSKTTLPIIFFIMLPAILSAGYNSFLFPLYSANLGLSTSSINNLFVLGQLVVYVCITSIEYVEGRWDKWRVAGLAVCLLGVVFVLFSFNTTLVWAVVTIALVGVLCKCADGWKALWPRSAASMGLHTGIATGAMFATRSVLLIVQPLLLGALLTMSNSVAVIIVGIICLVCSVLFYYTTRHSALAPEKQ